MSIIISIPVSQFKVWISGGKIIYSKFCKTCVEILFSVLFELCLFVASCGKYFPRLVDLSPSHGSLNRLRLPPYSIHIGINKSISRWNIFVTTWHKNLGEPSSERWLSWMEKTGNVCTFLNCQEYFCGFSVYFLCFKIDAIYLLELWFLSYSWTSWKSDLWFSFPSWEFCERACHEWFPGVAQGLSCCGRVSVQTFEWMGCNSRWNHCWQDPEVK